MGKFSKYLNNGKPFKSTSLWGMAREHEESKKKGKPKRKLKSDFTIHNKSSKPVMVKPENGKPIVLKAKGKYYQKIDGYTVPGHRYEVFKVPDTFNTGPAHIYNGYTFIKGNIANSYVLSGIFYAVITGIVFAGAGYYTISKFHDDNDYTWDELFKFAKAHY
jgi:hypothetical protein